VVEPGSDQQRDEKVEIDTFNLCQLTQRLD
jgi:hypothetical protein